MILMQAIVGGIAAVAVAWRGFRQRVVDFFRGKKAATEHHSDKHDSDK